MSDIVALQLYTVRDETAKDFQKTLQRIAEIGYAGVEFAGYGNLSAQDLKALLADTGLQAVGTHVALSTLDKNLEHELDYCLEIGCKLLVVPWLEQEARTGEGFKQVATRFNTIGKQSLERGITLAYHNHDFEFRQDGTETLMDQLVASTDSAYVKLELDTYWSAYAGIDTVEFIKKHTGRIASLHLKDMTVERTFTEVGEGVLDIAGFVEAAQESGTKIFIIENDQPTIASLESATRSFQNMHRSLT